MSNYEELLRTAKEHWEEFTTGKRRRIAFQSGGPSSILNARNGESANQEGVDMKGNPIWRGSGSVVNYVPAWERNF